MTNPTNDRKIVAAYAAYVKRHGQHNATAIAAKLGMPRTTVQYALRRLAASGHLGTRHVLPGFTISSTSEGVEADGSVDKTWIKQRPQGEAFDVPAGHTLKGVSALVDAEGRKIVEWIKTKEADLDVPSTVETLEAAFSKFTPAARPRAAPRVDFTEQLALYPWSDPHFGVMIWRREAQLDWDLRIAVDVIKETFAKVAARTPPTRRAMLLLGGDTVHADNNENRTARSSNPLQVDGRYPKVVLTACETTVANIDLLLSRHEEVEVIVLGGNHDEHASFAIAFFLHAWYRNEPRVAVDTSPSIFRFRQFGKNMFGFTHGHTVKVADFPMVMAARQSEMWGKTSHRFVHGFHVHHANRWISEGVGCITETHQIVAPADAWHHAAGYVAGRSLQSIIYDPEHGEVGRSRVAVV